MRPVSILVPTFNEADNLKELLPLLQWANELLIVDSFSTDKTVEIAKSFGAKVIQREYENSASQKNWAIPQATHEWVFLVDADERPSPELIQELKAILSKESHSDEPVAYWMGRTNMFMNQQINYSGLQGDAVIRLFQRDNCRYQDKNVHSEIETKGKVAWLKGRLLHYTFKDAAQYLAKIERYAKWSALDHAQKTPKVGYYHLILKPAFRFFKHFILKQGFRDGKVGFIVSSVQAWGVFLRYFFLKELQEKAKKQTLTQDLP